MSNGTPLFWMTMAVVSAAFGALHGLLFGDGPKLAGVLYGTGVGLLVIAYERGLFLAGYSRRLRQLPTLAYFAAAEISLVLVIVTAMSLTGLIIWALGIADKPFLEAVTPKLSTIPFALAVSALIVAVLRVRDLIGSETFTSFILGRYHRPVSEERVFLFLDLAGSTTYAERHGDLAAQELLKAVFAAIAEPVRRYRGQIDDYVAIRSSSPGLSRGASSSHAASPASSRSAGSSRPTGTLGARGSPSFPNCARPCTAAAS